MWQSRIDKAEACDTDRKKTSSDDWIESQLEWIWISRQRK